MSMSCRTFHTSHKNSHIRNFSMLCLQRMGIILLRTTRISHTSMCKHIIKIWKANFKWYFYLLGVLAHCVATAKHCSEHRIRLALSQCINSSAKFLPSCKKSTEVSATAIPTTLVLRLVIGNSFKIQLFRKFVNHRPSKIKTRRFISFQLSSVFLATKQSLREKWKLRFSFCYENDNYKEAREREREREREGELTNI